jgi:hypothetical protein
MSRRKMFGDILKRNGRTDTTIGHPRQRRIYGIEVGSARHLR